MRNVLKSLLVWILIIPLAILNGGLRDQILAPILGKQIALPISGVLLCVLIFIVTYLLLHKLVQGIRKEYIIIGSVWLILTIGMEFLIGIRMNLPMEDLLLAYDIRTGNLWTIIVLFTGVTPWLAAKIRRII